jgi:membrane associated rhomboid family serine protease
VRPFAGSLDRRPRGPTRWLEQEPVTRILFTLYVGMFVVAVRGAQAPWTLAPAEALALGAGHSLALFGEARYETLITASFLHTGIVVVALDALLVSQAGSLVERAIGSARMAPIALAAGAAGNLAAAAHGWAEHASVVITGATATLAGLLAAGCVIVWRERDGRGSDAAREAALAPLLRWLAVVFAAGVAARFTKQDLDPYALLGGTLGGALTGAVWRRSPASPRAVAASLAGSALVLIGCIAVVAVRDRLDRFASMPVEDRLDFTAGALVDGRCGDAADGLRSLDRLRVPETSIASLRAQVQTSCGRTESQPSVGPPSQRISP